MPELIAKGPFAGREKLARAGVALVPLPPGPIWSIALRPGGAARVAAILTEAGLAFPAPGTWNEARGRRIAWTGREQAFLFGDLPEGLAPGGEGAAVTDQSDGWAGLRVEGAGVVAALARLVALDLRPAAFPPGSAARTAVNHMPAVILRLETETFEILVFRSMADTLWHEMLGVLDRLAAREASA